MGKIIDLTSLMFDGAPTMPMDPKMALSWHCSLDTLGYNLSRLTTSTHQGTHIDVPRHFFYEGECVDEVDVNRCVVRAVKVDLTAKQPDTPITPADLQPVAKWLEQGCCPLLHTGWDRHYPTPQFFSKFPYVSKELAAWFVEHKTPLVGMDMPTLNGYDWQEVHITMLGANILIVEGIDNMSSLPANTPFTFSALPLKLKGRDGSPVRAVAILD